MLVAPWVQLFASADNEWPHNAPKSYHIISYRTIRSCQSSATSEIINALLGFI